MTARIHLLRTFAVGACLAVATLAHADGRPAEKILADYDSAVAPKFDPSIKKNPEKLREFRNESIKVEEQKNDLALELFLAAPENPRVPQLLHDRWVNTMMSPKTAAATIVEIEKAGPLFKDAKMVDEIAFMKAIASIQSHLDQPELALPSVDEYIKNHQKDARSAILLNGYAGGIKDVACRVKVLKRLVADYPESQAAKGAESKLALLENVGKPLDLEFVDAIKETHVSIKGLKGKVVILDFWATWCGPCIAEMPRMKTLYEKYKGQGVEFIGVSLDSSKEEGGYTKLKEFVAKNEISWPQYYQGNGWESDFSTKLGILSIPQLFLIDADGKLASIDARDNLEELIPLYLEKAKVAKVSP